MEAVAQPGANLAAEHDKVRKLGSALSIRDADLLPISYADALLSQR